MSDIERLERLLYSEENKAEIAKKLKSLYERYGRQEDFQKMEVLERFYKGRISWTRIRSASALGHPIARKIVDYKAAEPDYLGYLPLLSMREIVYFLQECLRLKNDLTDHPIILSNHHKLERLTKSYCSWELRRVAMNMSDDVHNEFCGGQFGDNLISIDFYSRFFLFSFEAAAKARQLNGEDTVSCARYALGYAEKFFDKSALVKIFNAYLLGEGRIGLPDKPETKQGGEPILFRDLRFHILSYMSSCIDIFPKSKYNSPAFMAFASICSEQQLYEDDDHAAANLSKLAQNIQQSIHNVPHTQAELYAVLAIAHGCRIWEQLLQEPPRLYGDRSPTKPHIIKAFQKLDRLVTQARKLYEQDIQ